MATKRDRITVNLKKGILPQLERMADEQGRSVSNLIEQIVQAKIAGDFTLAEEPAPYHARPKERDHKP